MGDRGWAIVRNFLKKLQKHLTSEAVMLGLVIVQGKRGSVPEWLMGADCKSAGYAYAGSNPARPTSLPSPARPRN
jgi:hypothetical protein